MARQQASETCENFGECSLLSTAVHCSPLLKVTISAAVLFEFLRSNRQRTNACDLASEVLRAVPLRSFAQKKNVSACCSSVIDFDCNLVALDGYEHTSVTGVILVTGSVCKRKDVGSIICSWSPVESRVESQVLLENARSVARRSSSELTNFDVGTAEEPFIITDAEMQIWCCKLPSAGVKCSIMRSHKHYLVCAAPVQFLLALCNSVALTTQKS